MLRTMHRVCGPALPATRYLIGMSAMGSQTLPLKAAQRRASLPAGCDAALFGDSLRTCRNHECMMAKRGQMSAACRMAMARWTSHRAYPRHYLHYRHCTTATAADFLNFLLERRHARHASSPITV